MTGITKGELQQLQRFAVQCELIESGHWRDYDVDQLNDPLVAELKLLDVGVDGRVITRRWLEHWLPILASGVLTRWIDTNASEALATKIAEYFHGEGWALSSAVRQVQRILEGTA